MSVCVLDETLVTIPMRLCTHQPTSCLNTIQWRPKSGLSSFGGFRRCTRETDSVICSFRAHVYFLAALLCACLISCYVLHIHTPLSIQKLWPNCKNVVPIRTFVWIKTFGHDVLIFSFLPLSRLVRSSVFLQDHLRQLIMIPLPNVLLLSRTPFCGMCLDRTESSSQTVGSVQNDPWSFIV